MLGNTPRSQTHLRLTARKSYALGLHFFDAGTKAAINIAGSTFRLVAVAPKRKGGHVVLDKTATLVAPLQGKAQVNLQAAELNLAPDEYEFDVTMISALGYSTPVLTGTIEVVPSANPAMTGTFDAVDPSTSIAAYVEHGDVVEVRVGQVGVTDSADSGGGGTGGALAADPMYAGAQFYVGPGPLPAASTMPNVIYLLIPPGS